MPPAAAARCALWWLAALVGSTGAAAQGVVDGFEDRAGRRAWDAAIGFVASVSPEYLGSDRMATGLEPGAAVRWGRVSLASRSAFAVRGVEPGAQGGLRVELARSERLRAGLGLRWDKGRKASDSAALQGMGDIDGTLRARLNLSWRLEQGWRVRASATLDALGRGSGLLGDVQLGRDVALTPSTSVGAGVSLGFGNGRYMQTWFGVTPQQAVQSGYAVYEPAAGLRDLTLALGGRTQLHPHWAVFYSASATRLLAGAADSPLARSRSAWGLASGLVYRF